MERGGSNAARLLIKLVFQIVDERLRIFQLIEQGGINGAEFTQFGGGIGRGVVINALHLRGHRLADFNPLPRYRAARGAGHG